MEFIHSGKNKNMHKTAEKNAKWFFEKYVNKENPIKILEIGSRGTPTIRNLKTDNSEYIGLDMQEGENVDVISTDRYKLPFGDNTFEYVISSSCFEHDECFWITYLEIIRILKPGGLFYLNAPSNGPYHGAPGDCWRFYLDAGDALVNWAKHSGYSETKLLEKFIDKPDGEVWEDYVCIFQK
jgi:SAM-dependent methyltransferase